MTASPHPPPHRASCQEMLASRLFQLAHDSDRVGLHREATALADFAVSVLHGRKVEAPNHRWPDAPTAHPPAR